MNVPTALFILLVGLGVLILFKRLTLRMFNNELYISIPFIKLTSASLSPHAILLDLSALLDPRLLDLAASGLLDKRLLLPRFILKELHELEARSDEAESKRAKRALEVVKKLETLPELGLKHQNTDFPNIQDSSEKVLKLARELGATILSADMNRQQLREEIRIINFHSLANALKPLMQRGESLKIKIQRMGKEERQGVGYLEDGTMVVVNGGGDYIGETIGVHVLSVKQTAAGRMVFCNIWKEVYDEPALA